MFSRDHAKCGYFLGFGLYIYIYKEALLKQKEKCVNGGLTKSTKKKKRTKKKRREEARKINKELTNLYVEQTKTRF